MTGDQDCLQDMKEPRGFDAFLRAEQDLRYPTTHELLGSLSGERRAELAQKIWDDHVVQTEVRWNG